MVRMQKSIKSLSNQERTAYVAAEKHARRLAVELECADRCVASALGLADCSDIRVSRSCLDWGRSGGDLCVRAMVYIRSSRRVYTFLWRISLPYRSYTYTSGQRKKVVTST